MELHNQPVRASSRLSAGFTLAMGSSPGFGSYEHYLYFALLTLGFPAAPPIIPGLSQAVLINSLAHSSIGTRSPRLNVGAPTPCRHTVSGTISVALAGLLFTFPSRY